MSKRHKPDPHAIKESHVRIPLAVLDSCAYTALSFSAISLLFEFYRKLRSTNNGNLSMTLKDLKGRGWSSPTTLARALQELQGVGFIYATRKTIGVHNGSKICNLYRLTDRESYTFLHQSVEASKPTKNYLQFKSVREAEIAIKKALGKPQKN